MAIQMTREEYERKYGVKPPIASMSEPIRMTRAEYEAKYSPQPTPVSEGSTLTRPLKEGLGGLGTLYGGGEQGIAQKLAGNVQAAAQDIQQGNLVKGVAKAGLRTAGDVAGTLYAPVAAGLNVATFGVAGKFFEDVQKKTEAGEGPIGWLVNKLTDIPAVQKFAMEHPNAGEDFGRALNLVMSKGDRNANVQKALTDPKAILNEATNQIYKTAKNTPVQVKQSIESTFKKTPQDIISKRVEELNKIDNSYVQLRKASGFSDDALGSRTRIASTDVLVDAVDETGTIRTKGPNGAVEQYRALTLENAEGVVKNNLERLGEKVNLREVKLRMENQVKNSGLEGADLQVALNKIDNEIEGLALRAEPNGDIPLALLQDAKISTTKNINYLTPPEVNTYRKAIAKTYKETIEKNSSLNVAEVNAELSKFLEDIALLERLDGRKVQGGKLGKHFAQISGNIIGATTGAAVGGPAGSAIGAIVGGELAGRIKGTLLKNTLGGAAERPIDQSPILKSAIAKGKSPRLALPAPKSGSPRKQMMSGPTINLPAPGKTLLGIEELYSSNSFGSRNQQYSPTPTKSNSSIGQNSTPISKELQPLAQEAGKYKSARELPKRNYAVRATTESEIKAILEGKNSGEWFTNTTPDNFKFNKQYGDYSLIAEEPSSLKLRDPNDKFAPRNGNHTIGINGKNIPREEIKWKWVLNNKNGELTPLTDFYNKVMGKE